LPDAYSTVVTAIPSFSLVSTTTPATPENVAEQPANWLLRAAIVLLVVYWLALITATHLPKVPEPLEFRGSDKVEHFLAYATLAALAGWVWSLLRPFGWRQALVLLGIVAMHGILDEVTQPIVGRNADVLDWCADMVGATLGVSTLLVVQAAIRHWRIGARG
jgi:VanZ family protein